ncbi:hypothetical protein L1987_22207 [Smallanthus sonchifolius]|uniref:Uncharacterized protein n=1 Tax=Smallanthus sonchifolius TaxID=185202 RepID=A0ACB9IF54_9ASTR|nr:hypothetical protein L1987_22207 [Smallanthus sonchifolius]
MQVHKVKSLCELCGGAHPMISCPTKIIPRITPTATHIIRGGGITQISIGSLATIHSNRPDLLSAPHSSISPTGLKDRFPIPDLSRTSFKLKVQAAVHSRHLRIAKLLSERPSGSLPSNTKPNPKAHVKAITLRSGRATGPDLPVPVPASSEEEVVIEIPDETPPREKPAHHAPERL